MPHVLTYHRPASLGDALALFGRTDTPTRLLAGGTVVNADPRAMPTDVVDLQSLGLTELTTDGDSLTIGAMVTLQELVDSALVPRLLRDLARRELASTLRTLATVGGTVGAADPESELLAGLLVHDAQVDVAGSHGATTRELADVLADAGLVRGEIVTSLRVRTNGRGAVARTARTPADAAIVAVVGRRFGDTVTLAATGVSARPKLIKGEALDQLTPPADFRGSTEYRRELVRVLTERVTAELADSTAGA